MNFSGRNLWLGLIALAVVLIVIGYATGWFGFGGSPQPAADAVWQRPSSLIEKFLFAIKCGLSVQ
jgi:ABC-type cobalt transport system substrate-binding protein